MTWSYRASGDGTSLRVEGPAGATTYRGRHAEAAWRALRESPDYRCDQISSVAGWGVWHASGVGTLSAPVPEPVTPVGERW